jgi:transcriptional regulator with XRE-family HTH domain
MKLQEYKKDALKNKAFRKEYERYDLAFEIGQMVIKARILKGLTQEKLAKLVKTKQPSIARLENGQTLPSLTFLERIAKAFGTYLHAPKFAFMETTVEVKSESETCSVVAWRKKIKNAFLSCDVEEKTSANGNTHFEQIKLTYNLTPMTI